MKVAVVGGGWAGLAAAVELTTRGARTTLIEAGRVPGGRARGVQLAGRSLDNGQHILLGAYHETLALMRRVGACPEALLERHSLQIVGNDDFSLRLPRLPAPLNLAWGLLTARGADSGEKLRTALWMQRLKRRDFRLEDDCSVSAWLDAEGQFGTMRRALWEPLCLAALNTPAEHASARIFALVLRDSLGSSRRADTDLLLPRATLGEILPQPACQWLVEHGAEVRLGQRVGCITPITNGLAVDEEAFDAVVLATAPAHATRLWPALATNFAYEPIATAYLQFSPNRRLPFPLYRLNGPLGQWVIDRGNGLLACIQSGHGAWEEADDMTLAARLSAELGIAEAPRWQGVIREKRATFSCRPGLSRPLAHGLHPGLVLAGDYTWEDYPGTLEGAVRSGLRAARLVMDH